MILLAKTLVRLGHDVIVAEAGRTVPDHCAACYAPLPLAGDWGAIIPRDARVPLRFCAG